MWFDLHSDRGDPLEEQAGVLAGSWATARHLTRQLYLEILSTSWIYTAPFSPQAPKNAAEERQTLELTIPNLHQQHGRGPEGDEGCSLGGTGGWKGTKAALWEVWGDSSTLPTPSRSGCTCRASTSQGQVLYCFPWPDQTLSEGTATAESLVNEVVCCTGVWLWKIK